MNIRAPPAGSGSYQHVVDKLVDGENMKELTEKIGILLNKEQYDFLVTYCYQNRDKRPKPTPTQIVRDAVAGHIPSLGFKSTATKEKKANANR